jgi:RsiW-degrading membrane proteinase PrsW (M82 family)
MESCSVISILPALIVAAALYSLLRYKYPKGKFALVHKTFLLGLSGVLVVFLADKIIAYLHLDSLHSLNRTLFYSFVLTAGVYEFWKFLILRLFVYPSKLVVKTSDVIVYSIFVASGFSLGFSIYSVYFPSPFIDVCFNALSKGPVFLSISIIMGYFMGISLKRDNPSIDHMTGLLLAVVFQGINRFCLLTHDTILHYLAMAGMFVIAITFIIISLRERPGDSN